VIVQMQDDSGRFEEVKEEPKKDDKGKGKEKEKVPEGMDSWNKEKKKAGQPFSKDRVFNGSKCNTWH
jgi:hypothetical protein